MIRMTRRLKFKILISLAAPSEMVNIWGTKVLSHFLSGKDLLVFSMTH